MGRQPKGVGIEFDSTARVVPWIRLHCDSFGVAPAYEFGDGLCNTTFAYSNPKLSSDTFDRKLTATVEVKRTGKAAGKETVQLYLSAPTDTLDKPAPKLKWFAKTASCNPARPSRFLS